MKCTERRAQTRDPQGGQTEILSVLLPRLGRVRSFECRGPFGLFGGWNLLTTVVALEFCIRGGLEFAELRDVPVEG